MRRNTGDNVTRFPMCDSTLSLIHSDRCRPHAESTLYRNHIAWKYHEMKFSQTRTERPCLAQLVQEAAKPGASLNLPYPSGLIN